MHEVRNGQLLTFRCPRTSSDSSPAVCQIRFSIASLQYRRLLFCYVMDDTESRNQVTVQCKARRYYKSPSRQLKNEGEKIFPRLARRDRHYTPLCIAFSSGCTTPKYLAPVLGIVKCEIRSCPVFWNLHASKMCIFTVVQVIRIKCRMFF